VKDHVLRNMNPGSRKLLNQFNQHVWTRPAVHLLHSGLLHDPAYSFFNDLY